MSSSAHPPSPPDCSNGGLLLLFDHDEVSKRSGPTTDSSFQDAAPVFVEKVKSTSETSTTTTTTTETMASPVVVNCESVLIKSTAARRTAAGFFQPFQETSDRSNLANWTLVSKRTTNSSTVTTPVATKVGCDFNIDLFHLE